MIEVHKLIFGIIFIDRIMIINRFDDLIIIYFLTIDIISLDPPCITFQLTFNI